MAVKMDNYIMWEQFFIINTQTFAFNMLLAPSFENLHISLQADIHPWIDRGQDG